LAAVPAALRRAGAVSRYPARRRRQGTTQRRARRLSRAEHHTAHGHFASQARGRNLRPRRRRTPPPKPPLLRPPPPAIHPRRSAPLRPAIPSPASEEIDAGRLIVAAASSRRVGIYAISDNCVYLDRFDRWMRATPIRIPSNTKYGTVSIATRK